MKVSVRSTCPRSNVQKDVGQRDRWVSSTSGPFGALRPSQRPELESPLTYDQVQQQTKQRQAINYLLLFFYCLYPPWQWIHPLGHSRCKTEQMLQFAAVSSNFFKTKVSVLWHISNIVHQTLWEYFQLWESSKLRLRLTGREDLLTLHNFTTFIHLLTNRAKRLLLKTFPASGAWQHTEADHGLCACSVPQLVSHKPWMSASHTLPDWELTCSAALSVTLSGTNWCQNWYPCKAKCDPKGLPHSLDGSAGVPCSMKRSLSFHCHYLMPHIVR